MSHTHLRLLMLVLTSFTPMAKVSADLCTARPVAEKEIVRSNESRARLSIKPKERTDENDDGGDEAAGEGQRHPFEERMEGEA